MVVEETMVCVCEYCCFERITVDNNTDDEELQHFLRAEGRNILLFYFIGFNKNDKIFTCSPSFKKITVFFFL